MIITLKTRTADSVRTYFEKANRPEIKQVLPQKAQTVEEALADYEETLLPNATSFGQTVYVDGKYVGDVWCYCIDMDDEPNCMLSFCVFELEYWSSLKVRHNIDVMHVKKNICDNVVGTLLCIDGKSKDTDKARMDLQDMNIRKELHLVRSSDRFIKPHAT